MKLHILFVVQFLWIAMQIASIAMQPVSNYNQFYLEPILTSASENQILNLKCSQGEHIYVNNVLTNVVKQLNLKCPNYQYGCSNVTYDEIINNFINSCKNKEYCEAVINDSFFGQQCKSDIRELTIIYVCSPYEINENNSVSIPTYNDFSIVAYEDVQEITINESIVAGCEGDVIKMDCENDELIIKNVTLMINSYYCSDFSPIDVCPKSYYESKRDFYKSFCTNKNNCSIPINSNTFGSQCDGDYRFVSIVFQCRKVHRDLIPIVNTSGIISPTMTLEGCEGSNLNLNCPTGEYILPLSIAVQVNTLKCGSTSSAKCSELVYDNYLNEILKICSNENTCVININDNLFGDMCIGDKRYVAIKYSCSKYPSTNQDYLLQN